MITVWPSLYRPADGQRVPARALFARVASPRAYARREDVPRWSGAEFQEGYRSLANVLRLSWLVLDFDKGATAEQIDRTFGDLAGLAHTTWSSTPDLPRWRVALVLSRAVDREEHDRVWRAGAAHAERFQLAPDYAARDASRAWALPARHDVDHYEHLELTGALFDVDAALTTFPKPEPMPEPTRERGDDSYEHRVERARCYLAKMPGAISGSHGHATTFRAALAMVRGFGLEPDDALALLVQIHNPLCQPAWSLPELRHKMKQAYQRARVPFMYVADRRRDGRAA